MSPSTFAPAAVMLVLAVVLGSVVTPLHPRWSARLLAIVAAATAVTVLGTAVFAAVELGPWAADQPVSVAVRSLAFAPAVAGIVRAVFLAARWAREVREARRTARRLVATDVPLAVAVPGRDGGVLVSKGLLALLRPAELRIVFEHERSHLRHGHHRYLAAGAMAAGLLGLRPLDRRLRFAVERWADEDAAEAVGDRRLAARTIARVALNHAATRPLAAFTGSGVPERVAALLAEPPAQNPVTGLVTVVGTGATTTALASSAFQLDQALALLLA
ncbi:M56 family metallopeptidase [Actinomadura atramentaria]|uniref:M56 family metallopeptidase n=1 Tax=Actinomadura atramentaria TaxID=1990 RepID=UPI0003799855|nr:M56 family metallopeptidase [Actinomadura atramentaria]